MAETPMTRVRTIASSTAEPPRGRPVAWLLLASLPMLAFLLLPLLALLLRIPLAQLLANLRQPRGRPGDQFEYDHHRADGAADTAVGHARSLFAGVGNFVGRTQTMPHRTACAGHVARIVARDELSVICNSLLKLALICA